jgi:hypothetical protein
VSEALDGSGFSEYGQEIPIAYGFSIKIYSPSKAFDWCETEAEKFCVDKLITMGGAMPMELCWMQIPLAMAMVYFNPEIGLAVLFKPNLPGVNKLMSMGVDTGNGATDRFKNMVEDCLPNLQRQYGDNVNYKELFKMLEVFGNKAEQFGMNFVPGLWYLMPNIFGMWYYTGALRRGKEASLSLSSGMNFNK